MTQTLWDLEQLSEIALKDSEPTHRNNEQLSEPTLWDSEQFSDLT